MPASSAERKLRRLAASSIVALDGSWDRPRSTRSVKSATAALSRGGAAGVGALRASPSPLLIDEQERVAPLTESDEPTPGANVQYRHALLVAGLVSIVSLCPAGVDTRCPRSVTRCVPTWLVQRSPLPPLEIPKPCRRESGSGPAPYRGPSCGFDRRRPRSGTWPLSTDCPSGRRRHCLRARAPRAPSGSWTCASAVPTGCRSPAAGNRRRRVPPWRGAPRCDRRTTVSCGARGREQNASRLTERTRADARAKVSTSAYPVGRASRSRWCWCSDRDGVVTSLPRCVMRCVPGGARPALTFCGG